MSYSLKYILKPLHFRSFASWTPNQNFILPRTIRQVIESASEHGSSTSNITEVAVNGWIKSVRRQKNVAFAQLSDGTDLEGRGLQVVFENPALADRLVMGASVTVHGSIVKSSGKGQIFELAAKRVDVLGECDPEASQITWTQDARLTRLTQNYPIQKKMHTTEFLREHANFRSRTDEIGRMLRLRHAVKRAFEDYYDTNGFLNVQAPVITMNDCEGGGEVFRVLPEETTQPTNAKNTVEDRSLEFFGRPAFLTVSSQLHLEVFSSAFSRVYTLQPAFRAEGSHTSRHLSEFWMLEAEIAFINELEGVMSSLETSVKYVLANEAVRRCVSSVDQRSYFESVRHTPWKRVTYTQAVESLRLSTGDEAIAWGDSISTAQERWLADNIGEGLPLFVTNYPADIKPFYMRPNQDEGSRRTVACFDLLIPRVGELAGGSMREERPQNIEESIKKFGMDPEEYRWYTELRRFGTTPHGGFGLGFERLISWIGGWENIRECIPAPRWKGRCIL